MILVNFDNDALMSTAKIWFKFLKQPIALVCDIDFVLD